MALSALECTEHSFVMRWGAGQGDPAVIYGLQLPRPPREGSVISVRPAKSYQLIRLSVRRSVSNGTETHNNKHRLKAVTQ